jgi:hypothetical protein
VQRRHHTIVGKPTVMGVLILVRPQTPHVQRTSIFLNAINEKAAGMI